MVSTYPHVLVRWINKLGHILHTYAKAQRDCFTLCAKSLAFSDFFRLLEPIQNKKAQILFLTLKHLRCKKYWILIFRQSLLKDFRLGSKAILHRCTLDAM